MFIPYRYRGLTYEAASRAGFRLVEGAAKSGNWFAILDDLVALRFIMNLQKGVSHEQQIEPTQTQRGTESRAASFS